MNGAQLFTKCPEDEASHFVFFVPDQASRDHPVDYSENLKLTERLGEMVFQL